MSEDKNEIIRIKKRVKNFVMMDKTFLEDERLSWRAKGILAYLLSKPDDWKVIVKDLIKHGIEGKGGGIQRVGGAEGSRILPKNTKKK